MGRQTISPSESQGAQSLLVALSVLRGTVAICLSWGALIFVWFVFAKAAEKAFRDAEQIRRTIER